MSTQFRIVVAVVAGFLGGFAFHYFGPATVHAQSPDEPWEIKAKNFVLVDETGVGWGVSWNGERRSAGRRNHGLQGTRQAKLLHVPK